ncbi:MAG: hypothetical protein V2B18_20895 [Pseudomonadota bacterium]
MLDHTRLAFNLRHGNLIKIRAKRFQCPEGFGVFDLNRLPKCITTQSRAARRRTMEMRGDEKALAEEFGIKPTCLECKEEVNVGARKCKHCGSEL